MTDRIRLDGRVAVVTGAAGVIGTATMWLLAERGARLVAVDRREQDLKEAIEDLPASAQALAVAADVTDEDEVAAYVRAAVDKFGTIDAFYNNAGIEGDIKPITEYSLEMFRRVIDVNVVGVFLDEARAPRDAEAEQGQHHQHRIDRRPVGIAAHRGLQRQQACGDRAHQDGGLGMHRHRRARQLPSAPGMIDSRMLSTILQGRSGGNSPPPNEKVVDRIPARRLGQASEVASIVAFLASDEASYVSGSSYTVDGGRTAA